MKKNKNKLQCPTCGTTTHKKGGLWGKKTIPITVEGTVFKGKCLACSSPTRGTVTAGPTAVVVTAAVSPVRIQDEEVPSSLSDNRNKDGHNHQNSNASPPTAMCNW